MEKVIDKIMIFYPIFVSIEDKGIKPKQSSKFFRLNRGCSSFSKTHESISKAEVICCFCCGKSSRGEEKKVIFWVAWIVIIIINW